MYVPHNGYRFFVFTYMVLIKSLYTVHVIDFLHVFETYRLLQLNSWFPFHKWAGCLTIVIHDVCVKCTCITSEMMNHCEPAGNMREQWVYMDLLVVILYMSVF